MNTRKVAAETSLDVREAIIIVAMIKAGVGVITERKDGVMTPTPIQAEGGVERTMRVIVGGVSLAVLGTAVGGGTGAHLLNE